MNDYPFPPAKYNLTYTSVLAYDFFFFHNDIGILISDPLLLRSKELCITPFCHFYMSFWEKKYILFYYSFLYINKKIIIDILIWLFT